MKVVFAGTPAFAGTCLEGLLATGHCIKGVLTQPDRKAGRGRKPKASAVKQLAQQYDLPLFQFECLSTSQVEIQLKALKADVMVVVAYGLLLPQSILNLFPNGCINVHASLLPRWRGAAPIQRAIEAADAETGISIMQMTQGLDEGPILLKKKVPITAESTALSVHDALAELGSACLVACLEQFAALEPQPQEDAKATYAHKIHSEHVRLNFALPAVDVVRKVRAFSGMPTCWFMWNGDRYKVLRASVCEQILSSGQVDLRENQLFIGCADYAISVEVLQPPGKKPMTVRDFFNGKPRVSAKVDDWV